MSNRKGMRYRKGHFEVPYPWADSDKLRRRYRAGWFDARDVGYWGEGYGRYNSIGRDAYLAGFDAGMRDNAGRPRPKTAPLTPPRPEAEAESPSPPPPPAPGTWSPWPAPRASEVEPPPGFSRRAQSEPLR